MGLSMQGSKVYIAPAATTAPVNAAAYNALSWTPINGVGNMGEIGTTTNVLSYPTWGDVVADKAKGIGDAGSPTLEVMRNSADAGQDALRAAAAGALSFPIKIERNDKLTGGGTNTIIYNWGLVMGPSRPQGGNEDFDVEIFTLAFRPPGEVVVDPT